MSDTPKRKATAGTRKGNGAGKGVGWGGPAKGMTPRAEQADAFEVGNTAAAGYHDMSKSERLEAHRAMLWGLGMSAECEATRVQAIKAYADREEGMPLQKTLNEHLGAVRFVVEK